MAYLAPAVRSGKRYMNPVRTTVGDGTLLLKVLFRYLTNREERVPKQPLGPFQTDARVYARPSTSGLRVTWMGHSSLLIEIDGVRVLIDPVWEQRAAPVEWLGPRRFFEAPLRLEELPRIDVVLISHDHYDHLGARTVKRLATLEQVKDAEWVTPLGVGAILRQMGAPVERLHELDWTQSVTLGGLTLTAVPSRHFSGRSLLNRFHTLWAAFVLATPQHRLFYGSDSGEWDGFAEIGRAYGPFDLTLLEIGAFDPLWSDIHMGPDGAARMFRLLGGQGLLMPIHWGLFDLALHAWRQPIERLCSIEELPVWAPVPRVPTEVEKGVEFRSHWWR